MVLVKRLRRIIQQSLKTSVCIKGGGLARQFTREGLTVYEDGLTVYEDGLTVYKCGEGQYKRGKQTFYRGGGQTVYEKVTDII